MTDEAERAYVRRWAETGRLLEAIRWEELCRLDPAAALRASDDLIDLALQVPLPCGRRGSSGLIDLQARLHASHNR